ncbi:putative glycoprotein [Wuhan flea virus]|uniref:putative glycoprotein n=1 Tax=Wuhan flea virus TaxID=1746071 RepID=UPI0007068733|nr:putative glycoprotein [Wuhan flea virus]ALL52912.1 putative glycoprotein [Wuhan flea virus]
MVMPTNEFVYLGNDDPYCYIEVSYDTWWLQSEGIKEHCLQEFKKMECTYLHSKRVSSETELFQTKIVEDCIGIKGSRTEIRHGKDGWYRILTTDPPVITPHGKLHLVMKRDGFYQLHEMFKWYGLTLKGNAFKNWELIDGIRKWIQPHWLLVTKAATMKDLEQKLVLLDDGENSAHRIQREEGNGKCDTLLNILGENFTWYGEMATSSIRGDGHVTLSCAEKMCDCDTVPLSFLRVQQVEHLTTINREESWYGKLFNELTSGVVTLLTNMLRSTFGQEWQMELIVALLVYYVTSQITKSVPAGIGLAFIIVWNMFLNR